jgi:uncharacterized spore protein YtfJ
MADNVENSGASADTDGPQGTWSVSRMTEALDRGSDAAHVSKVFGEPYKVGDRTLIPVAEVSLRYGFGGGTGPVTDSGQGSANEESRSAQMGGGGGGGGMVRTSPVAIIEVDDKGVTIKPVFNVGAVSIAGMLLAAWNVYWITRTIRESVKRRK